MQTGEFVVEVVTIVGSAVLTCRPIRNARRDVASPSVVCAPRIVLKCVDKTQWHKEGTRAARGHRAHGSGTWETTMVGEYPSKRVTYSEVRWSSSRLRLIVGALWYVGRRTRTPHGFCF